VIIGIKNIYKLELLKAWPYNSGCVFTAGEEKPFPAGIPGITGKNQRRGDSMVAQRERRDILLFC
jgi:hypothetical protein